MDGPCRRVVHDHPYRAAHSTTTTAIPPAVLSNEARTEREMFPSSRYSIMIDHTKNAAGKSAQKIPISTALELLPDCRIAQIAVTISRTAVVKDAMTTNTMRLMNGIIGVLRVHRQLPILVANGSAPPCIGAPCRCLAKVG